MSATASLTELRRMKPEDLRREVAEQRSLVAKLTMGVRLGKEKDSARRRRERRQLARMLTILTELTAGRLPARRSARTIPAPSA